MEMINCRDLTVCNKRSQLQTIFTKAQTNTSWVVVPALAAVLFLLMWKVLGTVSWILGRGR